MKMSSTEDKVITMHAELPAIREHVHTLNLVREIAASHRLEQMDHLRRLKTIAFWQRNNGLRR